MKQYLWLIFPALFFFFAFIPADALVIPPTSAFASIIISGQQIVADGYHSFLNIVTQGSITSAINGNNTITIHLVAQNCTAGQYFRQVDSGGNLVCG